MAIHGHVPMFLAKRTKSNPSHNCWVLGARNPLGKASDLEGTFRAKKGGALTVGTERTGLVQTKSRPTD